jgi:hypothetical protein
LRLGYRLSAPRVDDRINIMHGKYFSFGATSAVLTGPAVIVGLSGTVNPTVSIITALAIIAIADNVSDSFGIHVHQESQKKSAKEVRRTTIANFATRVLVVSIFILFVIFLPMKFAVVLSIFFGLAVISFISYFIAKEQEAAPRKIILRHLLLAVLVIGASFLLRELISGLITNSCRIPDPSFLKQSGKSDWFCGVPVCAGLRTRWCRTFGANFYGCQGCPPMRLG